MSLIYRKLSIPKKSTPEEALSIVAFFEDIITNIWMIHGHAMEKCFRRAEDLVNSAGPIRGSLLDPIRAKIVSLVPTHLMIEKSGYNG